ncbi:MAG: DegV family protein [Clostridia bacterium]|nr:DegV family protein [Clostridia bacterium]
MSNFIIMTDSTTDFDKEFFERTGVSHHPHGFIMDGKEYKDRFWQDMSAEDYCAALKKGANVTTSMPEMHLMEEVAEKAFKEGKDAMYISFSSQLSGTYNVACMVAADLMEKYPERKMVVIDSKCATQGQGILVQMAVKMRDEGKNVEEVAEVLNVEREKIYHFFTVDDLMHLKRGGRLSATSAVVGTLVGIKPILHMSDEGKLETIAKVRGKNNALNEFVKMVLDKNDESTDTVYLFHVAAEETANNVAEKLMAGGVKKVHIYQLGPSISAHLGTGAFGALFHSEK